MANESETAVVGASSIMSVTRHEELVQAGASETSARETSVREINDIELRIICYAMARWPGAVLRIIIDKEVDAQDRIVRGQCVVNICDADGVPLIDVGPISKWDFPVTSEDRTLTTSECTTSVTYYYINDSRK